MLQNAAYARPESQNIKLDVFSVHAKKSEKRNRPETARAKLLMGRRTEARKIVFGGPVRNSGFGVATGGRLSQKDRAGRDWSSPHDLVAALERLSVIIVLTSPCRLLAGAKKRHKSQSRTERNLLTVRSHVDVTFRVQVELMRKGASPVVYHQEESAGHVPIRQTLGCVVMVAVIRLHFTRP